MILADLFSCNPLPSDNAVRKNPIPALKKKQSNFNRHGFCKARVAIGRRDRFAGRKNSTNKGDARLLPKRRNRRRNGCTVTTNHLFLQRQLGRKVTLLPISQPNPAFLEGKNATVEGPGAGVAIRQSPILMTSQENLFQMALCRSLWCILTHADHAKPVIYPPR